MIYEITIQVRVSNIKALLNDNVVFGKGICETPAEKRAGKTPQRGTSEEA
ncbi:hypothetical protein [Bacillus sp. CECT 9360]|nr:hypothetical protein [Bacillus sp. CECT 9360]CAH0346047.1 hypothetical protein BCI9360_02359 [Bacillus sp. CECT 9360]